MIDYNYEIEFKLEDENKLSNWIKTCINSNNKIQGDLSYIFCNDEYLIKINKEYLDHDTYTDIISFDYCEDNIVSGDIFISIERVKENANKYKKSFEDELHRVMIHGVLHYLGYKDKSDKEKTEMRNEEDNCLKQLK
ncbi:MAG: rRNA maturation RNase YbeY [Flavobacteriaceae bacterium]|nr:rRNA maturation RNase YbeY [Flavobacteriaceae bacterium]